MPSQLFWRLARAARQLWVKALLFSAVSVAAALAGFMVAPWLPEDLGASIGADAVDSILGILASSMLTVTTFSLSVMVQAFAGASSGVTPRAVQLLMQDRTTQTALATFLGAFIFSLVGIIALQAGIYGERGRLVLYVVSMAVVGVIVFTMMRWIEHLTRFGRVAHTTARVEQAAAAALAARAGSPAMGGRPMDVGARAPVSGVAVRPLAGAGAGVGYVQHLDVPALQAAAERLGSEIFVVALPGAFVHPAADLARITGPCDDDLQQAVRGAFTLGDQRTFDTDPRFGLSVLAEIAQRALSPAVNDPGTAIDVIGRALRLLVDYAAPRPPAPLRHDRVHVPLLDPADLIEDAFAPIARDGAAMIEVQMRLQKALAALAACAPGQMAEAARVQSTAALAQAEAALQLDADRARLRALCAA
ncbi:DUF2254 domain-containing protein [Frigidibacter oleivorans]|uniref:DUF2254 domain-containing protein n=1 Tax=Frigidibacter oleivorans TaxID=2487129 RepID=UPI000F8E8E08|nr:DUF2254 domain-containing protein [Frigidibacter oleivorans]